MQVEHFPMDELPKDIKDKFANPGELHKHLKDTLERLDVEKFKNAVDDPTVAKVLILKPGTRTVFAGSVYAIRENGSPKRIGLSWQNTTVTIAEHNASR